MAALVRWNKRELCICTTVFRFISVLQHSQEHFVFICCIVLSFRFCVCSWIRLLSIWMQLILSIRIPCSARTTRKTSFVNSTFLGIFRSHCSSTIEQRNTRKIGRNRCSRNQFESPLNLFGNDSCRLRKLCVNEQSNVINRSTNAYHRDSWVQGMESRAEQPTGVAYIFVRRKHFLIRHVEQSF